MADVTSVKQLITDMDNETNDIATKVDALNAKVAELSAGTVTQADLDGISDQLTPLSARLKAIGSNPSDPIPA